MTEWDTKKFAKRVYVNFLFNYLMLSRSASFKSKVNTFIVLPMV